MNDFLVVVLILLAVLVASVIAFVIFVIVKKSFKERGPQGAQGDNGKRGNVGAHGVAGLQGVNGNTGNQGNIGERGMQGPTSDANMSFAIDLEMTVSDGIQFSGGITTKVFKSSLCVLGKFMFLQCSIIDIILTAAVDTGFSIVVVLPPGYTMTSSTNPVISCTGTVSTVNQRSVTPGPIVVYDGIANITPRTVTVRYVANQRPIWPYGPLVSPTVFFRCNFDIVLQLE